MLRFIYAECCYSAVMVNVMCAEYHDHCYEKCSYVECLYADCHYTECHYAECHYAECQSLC